MSSTNFTVTFAETGLATGQNWSVRICITPWCEDDDGAVYQFTNNTSMSFQLANGTYYYHVHAWNDTRATPERGNVTVAGASPATINIHFGNPPSYTVTFSETGLATGTFWAVVMNVGWWNNLEAGAGGWGGWGGWGDRPAAQGPHVLPQDGGGWGGDGGSSGFNASNGTTIQFSLPNGTYNYTVLNVTGYSIVGQANGSVNVSGASPATVNVVFTALPTYAVTFTETGLPNGTNWTVGVGGWGVFSEASALGGFGLREHHFGTEQTTSNASMTFMLTNGTYHYRAEWVDGFALNNSFGEFTVNGSAVAITLNFSALPEFNVTFNESGLPNGTDWGLRVIGTTGPVIYLGHNELIRQVHASPGLVTFHLPIGKYHYKLIPLLGWKASGGFAGKTFLLKNGPVTGQFVYHIAVNHRLQATVPSGFGASASQVLTGLVAAVRGGLAL